MRFESPYVLLLLLVIPVVVYLAHARRMRASLRFSSAEHTRGLRPSLRPKPSVPRTVKTPGIHSATDRGTAFT